MKQKKDAKMTKRWHPQGSPLRRCQFKGNAIVLVLMLAIMAVTTRSLFFSAIGMVCAGQIEYRGSTSADSAKTTLTQRVDARLPTRPKRRATKPTDKVLVVYSGPTDLPDRETVENPSSHPRERKKELYRLNFEHFLKYGVQCKTQDTVLVVTEEVEPHYRARITELNKDCLAHGHQVVLAVRNNTCLDMESVRRVLHDGLVDLDSYDYFVYVNCGTTGPSSKWADVPWTDVFIEKLNDQVKMSGLTVNCGRGAPHIQSMVYALDRVALKLIRESTVVFDCVKEPPQEKNYLLQHYIINRYERGLSRVLLQGGYGISPILKPVVLFEANQSTCQNVDHYKDQWLTHKMMSDFGRVLELDETVFYKTSRILPPETAREINFTLEVNWSW